MELQQKVNLKIEEVQVMRKTTEDVVAVWKDSKM